VPAHQSNYTKGRKKRIQYIVVHYTANDGDTARNNGNYFAQPNRNASAHYFVDESNIVQSVKVLTPELKIITLENKEMNFHYRSSFLQTHPGYICLEVTLKLNKGKKEAIEDVIKERKKRRIDSQPLEYPSAGSVFRNPINDHAGRLIEEAGLKGIKIGGAEISEKHANFIVNTGTATSKDIKNLIKLVHTEIKNKYGVDLIVEQEILDWK